MIIHSSMEYLRINLQCILLTFYFNWHLQKFRNKTDINDILSLMLIIDPFIEGNMLLESKNIVFGHRWKQN